MLTLVGRRKGSLPSKKLGRNLLNCPVYCSQQLTSAPLPRKPVKAAAAAVHLTRIVVTAAVPAVTTTTVAAVTTKMLITVAVILTTATAFNIASHHVPR